MKRLIVVALFCASCTVAQSLEATCDQVACTLSYDANTGTVSVQTGAPYSGQAVSEATDRAPIVREGWRDSAGRGLVKPAWLNRHPAELGAEKFGVSELLDPVAGFHYILDSVNRVAHRFPLKANVNPFVKVGVRPVGSHTLPNGTVVTNEDLGTAMIAGVNAEGQRVTQTSAQGVTTTDEQWMDPRNGAMLLRKTGGPQGVTTNTVRNYVAGEPDPTLLKVPSDYRIVDESGVFTFTIPRPK